MNSSIQPLQNDLTTWFRLRHGSLHSQDLRARLARTCQLARPILYFAEKYWYSFWVFENTVQSLEFFYWQTCQDAYFNIAWERVNNLPLQIINVGFVSNLFNAKRLSVEVKRRKARYRHRKVIFLRLTVMQVDRSSHGLWSGRVQRQQWRQGLRLVACPNRSQSCGVPS